METVAVSPASVRHGVDTRRPDYQALKARVHQEVISALDLARLPQMQPQDAEPEIRNVANAILTREAATTPLSLFERECLIADVLNELFGLGPLEALLRDPDVCDILVNRFDSVYIERRGRLEPTPVTFRDDAHLL